MACATYHTAPPYPTVVAVKLSTIRGPNGVAGFCGRSGLSASARNPDGLPMEPTLIDTTMAIGARAPRQHERQRHADTADDSEDARADVHHRVSEMRAFACWQLLQLQVTPQLHASPHWHEAVGAGAEFWQPQVHWVPTQVSQTQTFD